MFTIHGRCHCGRIEFHFDTALTPQQLPLRRCGCGFCRKHGARTTSDPAGTVRFSLNDPQALRRYRFGLHTADFLLCGHCGAYLAAVIEHEGRSYATLNANCFDDAAMPEQEAPLVYYEGETAGQRRARRVAKWTPVSSLWRAGAKP